MPVNMLRSPNKISLSQPDLSSMESDDTALINTRKRKKTDTQKDLLEKHFFTSINQIKTDSDTKYEALKQAIDDLRSQNETILKTNSNIEKLLEISVLQYQELNSKFETLNNEHKQSLNKLEYLEEKVEQLQNSALQNKLEIKNIPYFDNENLSIITDKLIEKVGLSPAHSRVTNINRSKSSQKPIIIEFQSQQYRNSVLKAFKTYNLNNKNNKINTTDIGINGEKIPIFANESLTPMAKKLFYLARNLKKNKNYKYCWTSQGKVYIKKEEGSAAVLIKSINQAETLSRAHAV